MSVVVKDIFEAAEKGQVGWITRTVERSIEFNINKRDPLQRTALHWAAECGHVDATEALLDYDIDIEAVECNGRTAVHLAARNVHAKVLTTLLEHAKPEIRAKLVNQPDNFGITPVFLTMQKGEQGRAAFQVLMDNGGRYTGLTSRPATLPTAHTASSTATPA